jgi:hypothetical protein
MNMLSALCRGEEELLLELVELPVELLALLLALARGKAVLASNEWMCIGSISLYDFFSASCVHAEAGQPRTADFIGLLGAVQRRLCRRRGATGSKLSLARVRTAR